MVTIKPQAQPYVAYHRYLTESDGSRLGFIRLTQEVCTACSPAHRGQIGILYDLPNNREQIQCTLCDFGRTRERAFEPGRRMNEGRFRDG